MRDGVDHTAMNEAIRGVLRARAPEAVAEPVKPKPSGLAGSPVGRDRVDMTDPASETNAALRAAAKRVRSRAD